MKKVLFASTALVAFTGAAVADVALSGRAEMGLFKTSFSDTQFFTDIDVTFTMSGETDNGLTFGASIDLDESADQSINAGADGIVGTADDFLNPNPAFDNNSDDGGATIFISGAFGTVTMGDTDGALDWALTEAGNVGNPGSIADDETSHAGYNGSYLDGNLDGQILRWDYTAGDFGVAVSVDDDNGSATSDVGYAIGLKYSLDLGGTGVDLGIGYQDSNGSDVWGISATANLASGLAVGIVYSDWDIAGVDADHIGVGIGYTTGAFSIHANYGQFDVGGLESDGYGLAAAYDLGGGAVVHFGYGRGQVGALPSLSTYSLGLGLSF